MKRILAVVLALGFALVVSCASNEAAVVDADEDVVEMVEEEEVEEAEAEEVEAAE